MPDSTTTPATETETAQPLLPGIEMLGAGYDIYGDYASGRSVKRMIIDWNRLASEQPLIKMSRDAWFYPQNVVVAPDYATRVDCEAGADVQELQHKLGVSAGISGGIGAFSGSISSNFSSSQTTSSSYMFSRVQQSVSLWTLSFTPDPEVLAAYIDPALKTALASANSDDDYKALFDTWGSHILTGISIGGRAVYTSATDSSAFASTEELQVAASASYGAVTGQTSVSNTNAQSSFNSHSTSHQEVRGGDVGTQVGVFSGDRDSFGKWNETIMERPVLIGFNGDKSLTGIWELCTDATKKAAIADCFTTWAQDQRLMHLPAFSYLDEIGIQNLGDSDDDTDLAGFTRIDVNLNDGTSADVEYLYFHTTQFDASATGVLYPECITDIVLLDDTTDTPDGYTRLHTDLNHGASGSDDIYLCYKKEACTAETVQNAIVDIYVYSGDTDNYVPRYGYTRLSLDLNKGAGGKHIYLYYKKATPV